MEHEKRAAEELEEYAINLQRKEDKDSFFSWVFLPKRKMSGETQLTLETRQNQRKKGTESEDKRLKKHIKNIKRRQLKKQKSKDCKSNSEVEEVQQKRLDQRKVTKGILERIGREANVAKNLRYCRDRDRSMGQGLEEKRRDETRGE